MNTNSILVSLSEVKELLVQAGLYKQENTSRPRSISNSKLSSNFLSVMYSNNYDTVYKTAMRNSDYDFTLIDDSFLQFSVVSHKDGLEYGKIRYAYFPNPRIHQTYNEFLLDIETTYEEAGDIFSEEYEQYIAEAKLKDAVTPIRYDYDYDAYKKDPLHPISHLHIGVEEDVRLPISRILTPQAFILIVIRNMYLDYWKQAQSNTIIMDIVNHTKQQCPNLGLDKFTEFEKLQSYIC